MVPVRVAHPTHERTLSGPRHVGGRSSMCLVILNAVKDYGACDSKMAGSPSGDGSYNGGGRIR